LPGSASTVGVEQVLSRDPGPELVVEMEEEFQRLLAGLDDELRALALLKMEGYTNAEAAARLGRSLRSVERGLKLLRGIWEQEGEP
jgi:DNA-directed RNA polymerase specialized sigma24 family protein